MAAAKDSVKQELWRRGVLSFKLDQGQKELYELYYRGEHKTFTWLLARRSGKCLTKDTLIMTPTGAKPIKDFKIGDIVYGYNRDGTLSETEVVDVIYSGTKKVRNIINSNKVLAGSTDEHKWLWQKYDGEIVEKRLGDVALKTHKLSRFFIDAPMGDKDIQHAYAIGALLGDGCSKQNAKYTKQIYISSEDEIIPSKVAEILNCNVFKNPSNNYTWTLSTKNSMGDYSDSLNPVECDFYKDWIHDKYAHEKIIDLEEIKKWNRKSLLSLLAGLIDTDGSVRAADNRLNISISMQSKSTLEAVQWILLNLFQYRANITIDDRDKYKNGPVYEISVSSNLFAKRALRELNQYIQVPRKKWKQEYSDFPERNNVQDYCGVKLSDYYEEECYDLSINNETHLFATADGLITHNTYTLVILALEQCLRKPNSIVKFAAPTKQQINTILRPLMKQILADCPTDIRPVLKTNDYIYYFPNGSEIQLAGTDNGHAEKLRGGDSHLAIVDEAGSCSDLKDLVRSILLPTTLVTNGKLILASTPPREEDHDFVSYIEEAEMRGSLIKKTIWDNPRLTKEQIDELIRELGGINTDEARRELLCELIKNASTAVIPEFNADLEKIIAKEWETPPYFDCYVAMDPGGSDLTGVLLGYFDYRRDKIIIVDEILFDFRIPGNTIKKLTEEIDAKELQYWNTLGNEKRQNITRVSDRNPILLKEIRYHSGNKINFVNTRKDEVEAAINNFRVLLKSGKIIINPRCKNFIRQLKNVKWKNKNTRSDFARSPDDGHYDLVAAGIYFVRNIVFSKNPYPAGYDLNLRPSDTFIYNKENLQNNSDLKSIYKKIFNLKR